MISTLEAQLIRRAAFLSAELERLEALEIDGQRLGQIAWRNERDISFALKRYVPAANMLSRVLAQLGTKRRPKPTNDGSDSLVSYFPQPAASGGPVGPRSSGL